MSLFFADKHDQFDKDSGIALRILREQPQKGYEFNHLIRNGYAYFSYTGLPQMPNIATIKLRYPSGLYDVKETWGYNRVFEVDDFGKPIRFNCFYKADGIISSEVPYAISLYSPVTMPAEAIRWPGVQFETVVKRVQALTKDEIEKSGLIFCPGTGHFSSCYGVWIGKKGTSNCKYTSNMDEKYVFKVAWNSLHGKSSKQGDKYVCYPYDNSKESMARYDKYLMGDFWYINDKPLIPCPNAYLEVISWKKPNKERLQNETSN